MVGRNEPCTCGSGKKYKKCCMNRNQNKTMSITEDDNYVAILDRGIMYKRAGHYDQARQCYIKAIQLYPKRSIAYYNLGKLLYIQEEFKAAVKSFKTALELGYDKTETMRHLGHALIDQNISEKEAHIVATYRKMVDPYYRLQLQRATKSELTEYDKRCVQAAISYMNEQVGI
jgi:tetratricopeptide (TPR) repeat protein